MVVKKAPINYSYLITFFLFLHNRLFYDSAELFSPFLIVQLGCNILALSVGVFYIDMVSKRRPAIYKLPMFIMFISSSFFVQHLQNPDFTLMTILMAILTQMVTAFIYCYFGKLATDSIQRMSDRVFDMNWQNLPIGLQKYVILMIANMQRPIYYHGSGIVQMNLNTFINVSAFFLKSDLRIF